MYNQKNPADTITTTSWEVNNMSKNKTKKPQDTQQTTTPSTENCK